MAIDDHAGVRAVADLADLVFYGDGKGDRFSIYLGHFRFCVHGKPDGRCTCVRNVQRSSDSRFGFFQRIRDGVACRTLHKCHHARGRVDQKRATSDLICGILTLDKRFSGSLHSDGNFHKLSSVHKLFSFIIPARGGSVNKKVAISIEFRYNKSHRKCYTNGDVLMNRENKRNMSMLFDFYEITMAQGYFEKGYQERITYFDLFFRRCPDGGGFAIAAGLEQIVEYIQQLHFDAEDIAYLRERGMFSEAFLQYLENFRFTGDIWAVPEGTVVFPREPILTVRAPAIEAQLIETYLLLCINHQSLIATKANRVVRAAEGRTVLEFGSRRAQGADAAILGARAAYIGGCHGTACTISDQLYGVRAGGTMAHAWVQMFDTEYEAFKAYCEMYPNNATLLVDTYNTLKSGVPNAIRAFNEVLKPLGITQCGIRLDSGDMAYLTREARKMLDAAGWTECKISVSNSLDEHIIQDVLRQGAKIDLFGVGERLITARSEPVFGGVYKLVAVEDHEGDIQPKIKISENVGKITTPHYKKLYRFIGNDMHKAIADYLCVYDETVDDTKNIEIFDPDATWKRKTVYDYHAVELQKQIFRNGELVYSLPALDDIRTYCLSQVDMLWDEIKRFDNPQTYYVDLSQKLWDIKYGLLKENAKR